MGENGLDVFVSGVSTHMMRGEVGAPLGACSPLGLAAPLSYIRRRWRPLSPIPSLTSSIGPLVGLFSLL